MPKFSVTIPYNTCLSKNNLWKRNRAGFIYLTDKKYRQNLVSVMEAAAGRAKSKFVEGKNISVDILVRRPDYRSDPSNFIDSILDILKEAINVDDRWYSGSWKWILDKKNPAICILVSQDV